MTCVGVAEFAGLVQNLPTYLVEVVQNQWQDLNLGSGPARGGGSSPPFRTNHLLNLKGLAQGEQIKNLEQSVFPGRRGSQTVC